MLKHFASARNHFAAARKDFDYALSLDNNFGRKVLTLNLLFVAIVLLVTTFGA